MKPGDDRTPLRTILCPTCRVRCGQDGQCPLCRQNALEVEG